MKHTTYTCDECRLTIVSADLLNDNLAREGEVYAREMFTVRRDFLAATGVTERTRYEWHFCSRDCLQKWSVPPDRKGSQ